jgi:raffinose/stachyose/melibiose transport system substrate-binding protein
MEFQTSVKGPNCPAICQEVGSGQITADEAATKYDDDCYKQAVQLGLDWEQ